MSRKSRRTTLPPPYLKHVWFPFDDGDEAVDWECYPFSLPLVRCGGFDLRFDKAITILIGENGSGKSTILESIARMAGFSARGGAQGMSAVGASRSSGDDAGALGELLKSSWLPQIRNGWFFRADTFHEVARYLDDSGSPKADYLSISHGEGFTTFFEERLDQQGLFFLDEPEAALSPAKQFEFLKVLFRLQEEGNSQIIMATHSPILMALPGADLWQVEKFGVRQTTLQQTSHFKLYREFILYPEETVQAMIW